MVVSHAKNSHTFQVSTPSDREIRMTRLFQAPRELVFDVMNKPEHVKRWWGCLDDQHSMPVCEIDLRPGGRYRFVNRGPEGEFGFHGVYREIDPPGRVVYTEIFELYPDVESLVIVELAEENGATRFTLTASYPSLEVRDAVLQSGMEKGAAIGYDRLEEVAIELLRG